MKILPSQTFFGGSNEHPWGGGLHPGGEGSASRGRATSAGVCIGGGGGGQTLPSPPPPPKIHRILRDTVNQRVVRILLECILVFILVS